METASFLLTTSILALLPAVGAQTTYGLTFKSTSLDPPPWTFVNDTRPPSELASDAYYLTCPRGPAVRTPSPVIYDSSGEVVWVGPACNCLGLDLASYEGKPVLSFWTGTSFPVYGVGNGVIMDETYHIIQNVTADAPLLTDQHEFSITTRTRQSALVLSSNPIPWNLSSIGRSPNGFVLDTLVQEVDITSGTVLFNWSAAEHMPLTETYAVDLHGNGSTQALAFDAYHLNSAERDTDGNYLISSRNYRQVFKLDRATGEIIWRMGGMRSDFAFGEGAEFFYQHHARWQDSTHLTVFDNGGSDWESLEPSSRGLYLSVDTPRMTVDLVREYIAPIRQTTSNMGSVQITPDGNVVVGYGVHPWIAEFGFEGNLLFFATLGPMDPTLLASTALGNYRAFKISSADWVGKPTQPPQMAIESSAEANVSSIFVSWNGATLVDHYALLGSPHSTEDAKTISTFPRSGFETQHDVQAADFKYIAVGAFAANGRELGRTATYRMSDGTKVGEGKVDTF